MIDQQADVISFGDNTPDFKGGIDIEEEEVPSSQNHHSSSSDLWYECESWSLKKNDALLTIERKVLRTLF